MNEMPRCGQMLRHEGNITKRRSEVAERICAVYKVWVTNEKVVSHDTEVGFRHLEEVCGREEGFRDHIAINGSFFKELQAEVQVVVGQWCSSTTTKRRAVVCNLRHNAG